MSPSELAELAGKAQKGDQKALEDLLEQSAPMIYYTALKMTGNVQDAEDLSQEAYVKLLEELPKLRDVQAAAKWIKLIVVNLCKNHMKKKRPYLFQNDEEEAAVLGNLPEEETSAVPDAYMDMAAKRQIITGMIDALPDKQKVTVYLYYYDELTVEQIAQLMEISEGTVKSRLSAARRTLQANVEDEERKGNKLYVIFPLLGRLLNEDAEQSSPPRALPVAVQKALTQQVAKGAAKAGAGLGVKVAAGVVAAAVVVGAAVGIPALTRQSAPVQTPPVVDTLPPTAAPAPSATEPAATSTPVPELDPTGFVPEDMLGRPLADMIAIAGQPTSQADISGIDRTTYQWVAQDYTYDFQVTCDSSGTIASVIVTSGPSILGLGYGDSQDTAQAALSALGNEDGVSSNAYGQQVTLSAANADGTLIYHVGCMDGTVTSVSVEILGTL